METPSATSIFYKLNPANSLFGRIFVWFWLSVSALLVSVFLLAKLIAPALDISEPNPKRLEQAQRAATFMQAAFNRGVDPERALRRVANRGRFQLVLVDTQSKEVILGFPAPILPSKKPLLELAESTQVIQATTPTLEFIGPFTINAANTESAYQLFVGRLLKREERRPVNWALGLVVILTVGSALCFFLAWRISKPLRQLGDVSKAFANGDFSARINNYTHRQDEIGQLAQGFNNMADKINASAQQQQSLLANVSHELRTPLTRLQLAVAMLEDAQNAPRYLSRIEDEIDSMDVLIGQVLSLTRMQGMQSGLILTGEQLMQHQRLPELLKPLLDNIRFEAEASQKSIMINDVPDITMKVQVSSFISAIENIARNAIKFAHDSVRIQFSVDKSHQPTLDISIEDDGDGLPSDSIDKVFQPFYQAHASNQTDAKSGALGSAGNGHKGSGLGLAIAKAAVDLHKGELSVSRSMSFESKGGLRFLMKIPIIAA
ncbi:ATP-binding protein [Ningiella sp. W23]|uniref:ATP-binding protein n=1 Tax=Ningiella sp. W23 TaxID=3023715 RepID=UPI003756FA35